LVTRGRAFFGIELLNGGVVLIVRLGL
jgi:hypothetical protein